jgi:hypothetical protein
MPLMRLMRLMRLRPFMQDFAGNKALELTYDEPMNI